MREKEGKLRKAKITEQHACHLCAVKQNKKKQTTSAYKAAKVLTAIKGGKRNRSLCVQFIIINTKGVLITKFSCCRCT
jgi:hypothetical protein